MSNVRINIENEILDGGYRYLNNIIQTCKSELKTQGHYVTGETEKSFKAEITRSGEVWFFTIWVKSSAIILNYGVKRENVPYNRGSGAAKSQYIQALLQWAANIHPSYTSSQLKGFVFAVANKAKKQGHPTDGSYAFTKNGRRKDWIAYSIQLEYDKIFDYIDFSKAYVESFKAIFA